MRDHREFDELYAATSHRIVGQVYLMTGNLAEAEDAVSEAFLKAWDRWGTVRLADSPEAWVRRVASRNAVSSWRKTRNRLRAHDRAAPDVGVAGPDPDHAALVTALHQLSPHQRRAIVLHHLVGLSVAEIAVEVGAPTGTVKARLARGRAAMRPHLTDHETSGTL